MSPELGSGEYKHSVPKVSQPRAVLVITSRNTGCSFEDAAKRAAINCLHCATNAAMAINKDATGEKIRCPGCKKQYRTGASNLHLVFTRHPSLAEAEQALNA
jgi:hypothetical protein